MNEMKKFYFIATALLITLGACTNDESAPEQNEIGFKAITTNSTRAILAAGDLPTTDNFDVWGFYTPENSFTDFDANAESNFMTGIKIEFTEGNVSSTQKAWRNKLKYYYWPSTGNIGFYAIHPSGLVPSATKVHYADDEVPTTYDGVIITDYTVNDGTVSGTTDTRYQDLMYGYAVGGYTATGVLPLTFNHALTQVAFRIKTNATYDARFFIKKITLGHVDLQSDFQFIQPSTIIWSNNAAKDGEIIYSTIETEATSGGVEYKSYNDLSDDDNDEFAILMIPQTLIAYTPETPNASEVSTITFDYKLVQADNTVMEGSVTKKLPAMAWTPNMKVVYTLNFSLNEISFDPQVTGWATVTSETIDLDLAH